MGVQLKGDTDGSLFNIFHHPECVRCGNTFAMSSSHSRNSVAFNSNHSSVIGSNFMCGIERRVFVDVNLFAEASTS